MLKRIELINLNFRNTVPALIDAKDKSGIDEVFRFLQEQLEDLEVHYKRLKVFESQQKMEFSKLQL